MSARACAALLLATLAWAGPAQAQPAAGEPPRTALRVCQDPNNLPFSNLKGEGFENKIAEVFGRDLGLPVTYYSFPNRLAFIRNTLRYKLPDEAYRCDVVIGVPAGFDQVSATKPYYRSTYALVFAKGKGLDAVRSSDDLLALRPERLRTLRIGVYDRTPASMWLARHDLVDRGVPYTIMNADPDQYPGQIIERDLAQGKLDAAIVWGPIAGFFARRVRSPELQVVPMKSELGIPFDYAMAMGVRYGEPQWKQQIEGLIAKHRDEILAILREYGVPLVAEPPATAARERAIDAEPMTTHLDLLPLRRAGGALLLACALPLALAQAPAPQAAPPAASPPPSQAEQLVFMQEHLANLREPRTLRYLYLEETPGKPPVNDRAVLTLTPAATGGCCDVHGDYLSGPMAINLPDIPQAKANPVLLYFLESEVRVLQKVTGGQAPHFRRRIRGAFVDAAQVSDTTVQWHGQPVPARMVRIVPFKDDPYRQRFMAQSLTEYAFVLADAVPGGVYQMSATVPGRSGAAPLVRRTLTFDEAN